MTLDGSAGVLSLEGCPGFEKLSLTVRSRTVKSNLSISGAEEPGLLQTLRLEHLGRFRLDGSILRRRGQRLIAYQPLTDLLNQYCPLVNQINAD